MRRKCLIHGLLFVLTWSFHMSLAIAETRDYFEFNYGQDIGSDEWVQSIKVTSPAYRSDVSGDVTVTFRAPGMKFANAMCWQQPLTDDQQPWGHDVTLTPDGLTLENSKGSFVFPADKFPHGPVNIRIFANNGKGLRDICELQLYNTGGVKWNHGIPKQTPPGAKGMTVVFEDDFDSAMSIANDGRGARYNAHKPYFGDFSGWPFRDHDFEAAPPFEHRDGYLRIKARKPEGTKGSTGLLATVDMDGKGFWANPPFYAECRFTAQSAPGTWPAFWTITQPQKGVPGDELDICELYGGVGKGNPNHPSYSIVSHFWKQHNPDGTKKKSFHVRPPIMELGGKSYWSTTFHTYAVRVDQTDTVYYFDNFEVLRHPTNPESLNPHILLMNYAIGGISGWKIDLDRYDNGTDMWIDYIRVFQQDPKLVQGPGEPKP